MKTKILLGLSIVYLLASVGCKKESAQAPVGGAGAPPTGKKAQVLTFTSPATMSNRSSLTATVSSSAGKAGGAITYVIQAGSGSATVNPTSGLITAVSVGTVTLTANSAGDAAYNPATASQLITINNKQPQKLTWNTPLLSNMTVDDKKPAAVTGASGKVTYTITATGGASATVSTTGEVTAITAGGVTLIATAAETVDCNPATAIQTITINAKAKKTQKLTWNTPLLSTMIEGETKTATVKSDNSNAKVTYTITAAAEGGGSATVDAAGKVTAITAGEVTLKATAAGDDTYNSATAIQTITIKAKDKKAQTLTWIKTLGTMTVGEEVQAVVNVANTKVTYTITAAGDGSATVNSETGYVTAISAGQVTLIATAAGTADYESATASQEITIMADDSSSVVDNDSVEVGSIAEDNDTADLVFKLDRFDNNGLPILTFQSTTLNPTHYVVIVVGVESLKTKESVLAWQILNASNLNVVKKTGKVHKGTSRTVQILAFKSLNINGFDKNKAKDLLQKSVGGQSDVIGKQELKEGS